MNDHYTVLATSQGHSQILCPSCGDFLPDKIWEWREREKRSGRRKGGRERKERRGREGEGGKGRRGRREEWEEVGEDYKHHHIKDLVHNHNLRSKSPPLLVLQIEEQK